MKKILQNLKTIKKKYNISIAELLNAVWDVYPNYP